MLRLGIGVKVGATCIGRVSLSFRCNKTLVLDDCLYIPDIKRNLNLVVCLIFYGYNVSFHSDVCISRNGKEICKGSRLGNLYYVYPIALISYDTEIMHTVSNKRKAEHNEETLWHSRLGHISLNRIKSLI